MTPAKSTTSTTWVIGNTTNAGKTTLASALIRALNETDQPAIGFKPYSLVRFTEQADIAQSLYGQTTCRCFGSDGVQLARASPLLSNDDLELIQPVVFCSFPKYKHTVLLRTGAQQLDNRSFKRPSLARNHLTIPNFAELLETVSNGSAQLTSGGTSEPKLDFRFAPHWGRDVVEASLAHLLARTGAKHVVCEGAGIFLPNWQSQRRVKHAVYIHEHTVRFWFDVNIAVDSPDRRLQTANTLLAQLTDITPTVLQLPICATAERDEVATNLIKRTLARWL